MLERDEVGLGGVVAIRGGAALHFFRIRRELLHQEVEENAKAVGIEGAVRGHGVLGQARPRDLTALREQRMAESDHPSGKLSAGARLRVPSLRSGAEKTLDIKQRGPGHERTVRLSPKSLR